MAPEINSPPEARHVEVSNGEEDRMTAEMWSERKVFPLHSCRRVDTGEEWGGGGHPLLHTADDH